MILQTKKLDEFFIFLFMSIYFIFGISVKIALFIILTYSILHYFSKNIEDLKKMKNIGININNKKLYYSKFEKLRLFSCLVLIILSVGFDLTSCMVLSYIIFIGTFFYEKLIIK